MSAVEMPSEVERVRMAYAEIGYDPSRVGPPFIEGSAVTVPRDWPMEVRWRARETAMVGDPICFACKVHVQSTYRSTKAFPPRTCVASRRFEQDCGVKR